MNKEEKIFVAFQKFIAHCVDNIGFPKKPTVKQVNAAIKSLNEYDKHLKAKAILESWRK